MFSSRYFNKNILYLLILGSFAAWYNWKFAFLFLAFYFIYILYSFNEKALKDKGLESDKANNGVGKRGIYFAVLASLLSSVVIFITLPMLGNGLYRNLGFFGSSANAFEVLVAAFFRPLMFLSVLLYLLLLNGVVVFLFKQKRRFVLVFFLSIVFTFLISIFIAPLFRY